MGMNLKPQLKSKLKINETSEFTELVLVKDDKPFTTLMSLSSEVEKGMKVGVSIVKDSNGNVNMVLFNIIKSIEKDGKTFREVYQYLINLGTRKLIYSKGEAELKGSPVPREEALKNLKEAMKSLSSNILMETKVLDLDTGTEENIRAS